jgi:ferritin
MISERIQRAFNEHISHEFSSSYLYLSMAAWLEDRGLKGCAHWMRMQEQEERFHVMRFFDFVLHRGGKVKLGAIAAPEHEWTSPLDVFEKAYAHECEVSRRIHALVDTVRKESDHPADAFLQWFVNEQVEEEANVSDVVSRLRLAGDDGRGILLIDRELAARSAPTSPAA